MLLNFDSQGVTITNKADWKKITDRDFYRFQNALTDSDFKTAKDIFNGDGKTFESLKDMSGKSNVLGTDMGSFVEKLLNVRT